MKITKSKLKQIIKEELEKIFEDKSEHIAGISAKIDRLQKAVESAQNGMSNMEADNPGDLMSVRTHPAYWAKQQEVTNLNDKITLLLKQLQQLKQDEPGGLARP